MRSGVTANPTDLNIARDDFIGALLSLGEYVERERLDYSIVNAGTIDAAVAGRLWKAVAALPRH